MSAYERQINWNIASPPRPTQQEIIGIRTEARNLRERVALLEGCLIALVRDGIANAPCPTPRQWAALQKLVTAKLDELGIDNVLSDVGAK